MTVPRVAPVLLLAAAGCGGEPAAEPPPEPPEPPAVVVEEADELANLVKRLLARCEGKPRFVKAFRWRHGRMTGTVTFAGEGDGEGGEPDVRPLAPHAANFGGDPPDDGSGYLVVVTYPRRPAGAGAAGKYGRSFEAEVFGASTLANRGENGFSSVTAEFGPLRGSVAAPDGPMGSTESAEAGPDSIVRRFAVIGPPNGSTGPWLEFRVDRLPDPAADFAPSE